MPSSTTLRRCSMLLLAFATAVLPSFGAVRPLGDLDGDGVVTVLDLTRLLRGNRGQVELSEGERLYADLNRDGVFNDADAEALVKVILGTENPSSLPLATVLDSTPANGATGISRTREFVIHFTLPLATDTVLTTYVQQTDTPGNLYAEFGGRRLLTRVELSSDRRKATLFYLEPLPSNARVRVTMNGSGLRDLAGREIDVDGDGNAGGVATFEFDTLTSAPLASVGMVGTVYGVQTGTLPSAAVALAGVTITVDGAEQTLRTTTDAQGKFVLSPAPSGRFFVLIDGRTAAASGVSGYYAFVGKAWVGVPGKLDEPVTPATATNAAGDIFLPFIPADTLKAVSSTQETPVTFPASVLAAHPELEGVEITVPANALFSDNGARGGKVGIAPVSPDKLPEPLPTGLAFPLVITIQTDGATNFDRPVPVRFPNLPDPVTGRKLAAGAKSALFSFNHDTGTWEMGGSMTVSADGRFVETDNGVGVRQPGWHGTVPFGLAEGLPPRVPCGPEDFGGLAESRKHYEAAEETLDARLLDTAKKVTEFGLDLAKDSPRAPFAQLGTIAGKALGFLDPILKTRDCVQQSLDGAPNFFGSESLFYMPRGCVDMAVEFALLPLTEIKSLEKALDVIKGVKGVVDLSDTMLDVQSIESELDQANEALLKETPCDGASNGDPEDARRRDRLAKDYDAYKKALEEFAKGAPQAEVVVKRIEEIIPRLEPIKTAIDSKREDLGLTHAQQATFALSVMELYTLWEQVCGKGGFVERAETLIAAWSTYSNTFNWINSYAVTQTVGVGTHKSDRLAYMLEYRGVKQRVTPGANGALQVFLPENVTATLWVYGIDTKRLAKSAPFVSGAAGTRVTIPVPLLKDRGRDTTDTDGDGLIDLAEAVVGSDPTLADSNGDGISDAAALEQGLDPVLGRPSLVGVVAAVETAGSAVNVAADGDRVVVANANGVIDVVDASSRTNPRLLGRVNTAGTPSGIAVEGRWLVVSAESHVSIVDLQDPLKPKVARTLPLGSSVFGVAISDGLAAVAQVERLGLLDVDSGELLATVPLQEKAEDVVLRGDLAYVLGGGVLTTVDVADPRTPSIVSRVTFTAPRGSVWAPRLFAGLDKLYASYFQGVNVLDIGANPRAPKLLASNLLANLAGFKQVVMATPTLGVATAGNNSSASGTHLVEVREIDAAGSMKAPQAALETAGLPTYLQIVRGLGYVASADGGLQVVNYLPTETGTVAPNVTVKASFPLEPSASVDEGSRELLTVDATDNVQVRNVELWLNGSLVANDTSFPFLFPFTTPTIAEAGTSFTFQVRAYDTAGNVTATPSVAVELKPDSAPPRVLRTSPLRGAVLGSVRSLTARFSESVATDAVAAAGVRCVFVGADARFGTDDDRVIPGVVRWLSQGRGVALMPTETLAPGTYRFEITRAIHDLAGNALSPEASVPFRIWDRIDSDEDGLPDDLEASLGLRSDNPDTDGDGIPDGQEDFDRDGLTNVFEVRSGTNPADNDSNQDGTRDGDEDLDGDTLTALQEAQEGTDPLRVDTDGDGWSDDAEVASKSSPTNATETPKILVTSTPVLEALQLSRADSSDLASGVVLATPSLLVTIPSRPSETTALGPVVALPSISATLAFNSENLTELSPVVASPPLTVTVVGVSGTLSEFGPLVAEPHIEATLPSSSANGLPLAPIVATPPLSIEPVLP